MSEESLLVIERLTAKFPDTILDSSEFRGEHTLIIKHDSIRAICSYMKQELGFTFLADLTAVDYLEVKSPRYEVVYHVHRFGEDYEDNTRLRLKVPLEESSAVIDSVTPLWIGADWLEREVYDMFGIEFTDHPDLRRILMPEDYEPYPLRKDFDVRDREASKESFTKALKEGIE